MGRLIIVFLVMCSLKTNAQNDKCIVTGSLEGSFNVCNTNPYRLIFNDEFNQGALDLSKWEYPEEALICSNPEQQYYTQGNNINVSNGTLKLIAKQEGVYDRVRPWLDDNELVCGEPNKRWFYFTSGFVKTTQSFSYGIYEARVKIPKGRGLWPAFWTFSNDPIFNEIDVFEFVTEKVDGPYQPSLLSKVHRMNVHHPFNGGIKECPSKYTGVDFSQDFHVFSLVWEKDKIQWYVDGQLKRTDYLYYEYTFGYPIGCQATNEVNYFNKNRIYPDAPMHIIFNLAIQSETRSPDNTTVFPNQMEVDWVRYFQRRPPCGDVTITNPIQYPLSTNEYNGIYGKKIILNCNCVVPPDYQVDFVAENSVTFKPGFQSKETSSLNARINPSICGTSSNQKRSHSEFTQEYVPFINIETSDEAVLNEVQTMDIQIYPNPFDRAFRLDFGSNEYQNYEISIFGMDGRLVYSQENLVSPLKDIDLNNHPDGVYILYLLNKEDGSAITYRLVSQ